MCLSKDYLLRDRYIIIKELGKGGWGITYLARDIQLPSKPYCVVKEITPSVYLTESQNQKLFEREVNALYTLGIHGQIPDFFARFQENNKFYLIQEYICGTTLEAKLGDEKQFTELEVIKLLKDILGILQEVHQQNYIHRDIKPGNLILREEDNKICLIDFGAVKELSGTKWDDSGKFQSTIVIGTHGYIPAEQANKTPQHNSDIYSLGITIIRLLTGLYPPISSNNNADHLKRIKKDSATGEIIWNNVPPLLTQLDIKPEFQAIINKMVRYDFRDRYQSVSEISEDLEKLYSTISLISVNKSRSHRIYIPKILLAGLCGLIAGIFSTKIMAFIIAPKSQDYAINFTEVCNDTSIKSKEFENHQGSPEHITFKTTQPIWSVFSWKCVFSNRGDIQIRGVDLDNYCSKKYPDSKYQYEAYFKNYLDKNSWYCTNVGTKLQPTRTE